MTNFIGEQALLPFEPIEREPSAPIIRSVPTRRPSPPRPNGTTKLMSVDPARIAFHPAFGGAEEVLARRYEKETAAIASRLRSGNEHTPIAVASRNEDGSYILIGHPAELLAARTVQRDDPAFNVTVVVRPSFEPAAHYAGLTASLRRPSDWERYLVAEFYVQQAGSSRAALELLGIDPAKKESAFSRLLSVGKLLAAIPQLDPLTISASIAARVIALRSDRSSRTAMDKLVDEAMNATTDLLDARKILPRLIATANPGAIAPEMVRLDPEVDTWMFQRTDSEPLARVANIDQIWSVQILQNMDAVTWRSLGRATAALMK